MNININILIYGPVTLKLGTYLGSFFCKPFDHHFRNTRPRKNKQKCFDPTRNDLPGNGQASY